MRNDFVVFILTHGRANNMHTYKALMRAGYTGKVIFVVDNEDKTVEDYYSNFGRENVYVFDKIEKAKQCDSMDLSPDRRAIIYARCATYDIAEKLGIKYFLQLDDDYSNFRSRVVDGNSLKTVYIRNFDHIVDIMIEFLITSGADTVAFSQIGDFIGGVGSKVCKDRLARKAMNSFFCRTDKRLVWSGRMNEDVTAYITLGGRGRLFFTIADLSIDHLATQSLSGGMSESYSDSGTYIKTFYTIMSAPSSVKLYTVGTSHKRFHHVISWENAVPKIISDIYKKGDI
jgi:hypothetical protein